MWERHKRKRDGPQGDAAPHLQITQLPRLDQLLDASKMLSQVAFSGVRRTTSACCTRSISTSRASLLSARDRMTGPLPPYGPVGVAKALGAPSGTARTFALP